MLLSGSRVWDSVHVVLLTLCLVLAMLRLEGVISCNWLCVLTPLLLLLLHIILFSLAFYWLQHKHFGNDIHLATATHDLPYRTCHRFPLGCLPVAAFVGSSRRVALTVISLLLSLLPFVSTVVLRCLMPQYVSAWIVPIPLHSAALFLLVLPCTALEHPCKCGRRSKLAWVSCYLTAICTSAFLVLLSVQLALGYLPWVLVFTPLALAQFSVPTLPFFAYARFDGACWAVTFLSIPPLVSELLIAVRLDAPTFLSWTVVLLPLTIWWGVVVVLYYGLCLLTLFENDYAVRLL
eukprot:TRINITY_DN3594_c0_g1_i2.p1 TRINITY_DN3594_c0_g1~~TRINITY_DN3594_c0_g1_i2.p1  ORF type:complete len:292 (+),score=47.79 TRINITY_DN3594_c0_g1_i2:438-1313(+)